MNALQAMRCVYGPFPDNYFVVDCETVRIGDDVLPVTVSVAVVVGRQISQLQRAVFDWTKDGVSEAVLKTAVEQTNTVLWKKQAQEGKPHQDKVPWSLVRSGSYPAEAMASILTAIDKTSLVVGHNIINYDGKHLRPLASALCPNLSNPFVLDRLFDTGRLEIALRLGMAPVPDEHITTWQHRCAAGAYKTKWSLSRCAEIYNLYAACNLRQDDLHDDRADVVVNHALMETYRRFSEEALHG